ncbi:hypothetical protein Taro_040057 [Colocasia esculenta]|uniref:Uncharacterized protein n=1 Tax=Colocasia esculenta TaxID=4460 RepID=A0A843WI33_COLES|nr:hypothetical protein [Colocasia esculenta]
MVKGTQVRVSHDLLKTLFDVTTSGHSGIHTVDIQTKGLGIVGPEFRLKDDKLDINQMNAFNRLLHFVVCQIVTPRSATFSTCTRADSDLMFWAIQNQEINTAKIMIERMKFASAQVWDTKSKLNVSLPYAHLLTKIFKHFDISIVGDVSEKMGQAIRSRNLRKSGFSVVNGVWSKTSVAEGQAIIGEAQEGQEAVAEAEQEPAESTAMDVPVAQEESVQAEASTEARVEVPSKEAAAAGSSRIEDIPPENIEPVGHNVEEVAPSSRVAPILLNVLGEQSVEAEGAQTQGEQGDAPAVPQGEYSEDVPMQEGVNSENVETGEPTKGPGRKLKRIARRRPKKQLRENLKPLLKRLDDQAKVLSSVQSEVNKISINQTSATKEMSQVKNAVRWFNKEMGSMKSMLSEILKAVGAQAPLSPPTTAQRSEAGVSRPPGSAEQMTGPSVVVQEAAVESGPSRPAEQVSEPSGPPEEGSGPARPVRFEQSPAVEADVAPEPPVPSPILTPAPLSPPSSSTAPPAPQPFKQPQPRTISSPTPFPSQSSFSPSSSQIIPPRPVIENPPASSSARASSSSSHSTSKLSSSFNSKSLLYPSTPPTSITFIPQNPQLGSAFLTQLEDEFERSTLTKILEVATHVHRTVSSSPPQKKRKFSTSLSVPSTPKFPPLWFSLTAEIDRRPIYREYLQKCILSTIFGIPFLNLTDHLTIVLPYYHLSKANQSKIFLLAECKSEDQWAKGYKTLYTKYLQARDDSISSRDYPLSLSEWFVSHHQTVWGQFILKEIRIARHFQLYNDYCYLNKIPEVQFGQFHDALALLRTEHPSIL